MSEETPEYLRLPDGTYSVDTGVGRTIFADPALLRPDQLAEMQRTVDDERTNHAGEPVTKMGYWPTAVAALLGHARALAKRADDAKWATDCAQGESRVLRAGVASLIARVEKAEARVKELEAAATETGHELTYERQMRQQAEEARDKLVRRVKEQQAELSEQEVDKLTLLRELRESRAALHNATR